MAESRLVIDGTGWAYTNHDFTKMRDAMEIDDLVRNKTTNELGIVRWNHNQSSWWHRKKGLTGVAVLLTKTGKTVWWKPKEIEVISACK